MKAQTNIEIYGANLSNDRRNRDIISYYKTHNMRVTIKYICKQYGYSISASAKLFHEVAG